MKSKQPGALEKVRNLVIQNSTKYANYATISPEKLRINDESGISRGQQD